MQLHCNKLSETTKTFIFFNHFPVRLETPHKFPSSGEKNDDK